MRKSRFTDEQVIGFIKQADAGMSVAGRLPGYDFSVAMQRSGIVWDERALDRFLAAPMRVVPETTMTYAGVPDAQDRRDLIAYLRAAGQGAACRPPQAAAKRPPLETPR